MTEHDQDHKRALTKSLLLGASLAPLAIPALATAASATVLNSSAVQSYEYEWWGGHNPAYDTFGDDCTNFVSQVIAAGGEVEQPTWYYSGGVYTDSWTVALSLFDYLTGGGSPIGSLAESFHYYGSHTAPSTVGMDPGDPFFYNWSGETDGYGDGEINHATVTYGNVAHNSSTQDGTHGTEIASHTTPRFKDFWTLRFVEGPANAYWQTESVFGVHIKTVN